MYRLGRQEMDVKDIQQVSMIKDRDILTYTRSVLKGREEYVEEQMNDEN